MTRDTGRETRDTCPASRVPRPRRGFSLVELIVSLAILSGGLLGVMYVFPVGLRASQRSELSSRAALVGQQAMESLKLLDWAELPAGTLSETVEGFTVTTTVSQPETESLVDPTRLKAVSITVSWSQDGRERSLLVMTYLRRPVS